MKSESEEMLLEMLRCCNDNNAKAVLLQSYIQHQGPLSEQAGKEVRAILKGTANE